MKPEGDVEGVGRLILGVWRFPSRTCIDCVEAAEAMNRRHAATPDLVGPAALDNEPALGVPVGDLVGIEERVCVAHAAVRAAAEEHRPTPRSIAPEIRNRIAAFRR